MKKFVLATLIACAVAAPTVGATAGASAPDRGRAGHPSTVAERKRPKSIKGWKHYEGRSFFAWVPNEDWQIVDAATCCIDVTSPTGDAAASYGWSGTPGPLFIGDALRIALSETADVQIVDQGAPFQHLDGARQVTEYTGFKNGSRVHGVATIEVYQNAGGYGFRGYIKSADTDVWNKYKRTLELILRNITYAGRNANDPYAY